MPRVLSPFSIASDEGASSKGAIEGAMWPRLSARMSEADSRRTGHPRSSEEGRLAPGLPIGIRPSGGRVAC